MLSSRIEEFITATLSDKNMLTARRKDLAGQLGCSLSEIDYVLKTRFNLASGYIVQSRRGSGGFIRIIKVDPDDPNFTLEKLIKLLIGDGISQSFAYAFLNGQTRLGNISRREANILKTAVTNKYIFADDKNAARAVLLKAMLASVYNNEVKDEL